MTTPTIRQLGYVGLTVTDLGEWESFATEVLGLESNGRGADGCLYLTNDSYHHRLILHQGNRPDIAYVGWEVFSEAEMEATTERLARAGAIITKPGIDERKNRGVIDLRRFIDPEGLVGEIFYGPIVVDELDVSRTLRNKFVSGDLGLGHYTLAVKEFDRFVEFYQSGMGFVLSAIRRDIRLKNGALTHVGTLRCNGRHHSIAIVNVDLPRHIMHLGLEVTELDDIGRAMDKAGERGIIKIPLGRHASDHMLSFYMEAPSGIEVEYGWGSRILPPDARVEQLTDRTSIWGHKGIL
jgi:2,3-dihydroxybiphenyl 1,2-dioxygenase